MAFLFICTIFSVTKFSFILFTSFKHLNQTNCHHKLRFEKKLPSSQNVVLKNKNLLSTSLWIAKFSINIHLKKLSLYIRMESLFVTCMEVWTKLIGRAAHGVVAIGYSNESDWSSRSGVMAIRWIRQKMGFSGQHFSCAAHGLGG